MHRKRVRCEIYLNVHIVSGDGLFLVDRQGGLSSGGNAGYRICGEIYRRGWQQEDKIVSVLMAANKCADVSVHTHGSFFSQMARRYRSLGSCWEKLFENLVYGQGNCLHTTFKITSVLSDECDARLKNAGYYIYTLRKIII